MFSAWEVGTGKKDNKPSLSPEGCGKSVVVIQVVNLTQVSAWARVGYQGQFWILQRGEETGGH